MTLHKHQCPTPTCRYIWQHDDVDIRTDADNERFHTCINCGAKQYWKYFANASDKRKHDAEQRRSDLAAIENLADKVASGEMSMVEAMLKVIEGDL